MHSIELSIDLEKSLNGSGNKIVYAKGDEHNITNKRVGTILLILLS